jgi:hypothetical protein
MDYHQDRFEDHSLMIYKDESIYALLPANVKGDTIYSHQGLTYGGFILKADAKLLDSFEAFKCMLEFLNSEGIEHLDIRVIPSIYNSLPSDEINYFLFRAGAQLIKRDVMMVIDYHNQLPFKKNRREGINKAKRNGLEVNVDDNFETFWNEILIPNLSERYNTSPVHSLKEIELLASRFPENIRQVNVYKGNQIVAGTTVFLTKNTVHPQYVSGNTDKNAYGSLDLLYHFIINEFKDDRRYFDFNTSSEEDGRVLNQGLIFWKEGSGARPFTFDNYTVDTSIYKNIEIPLI